MIVLDDVLSAVNRLSLAFQRTTVDLTVISPLLNSTVSTLEKLKQESAGDFEARVKQLIARTTTEVNELSHLAPDAECEIRLELIVIFSWYMFRPMNQNSLRVLCVKYSSQRW